MFENDDYGDTPELRIKAASRNMNPLGKSQDLLGYNEAKKRMAPESVKIDLCAGPEALSQRKSPQPTETASMYSYETRSRPRLYGRNIIISESEELKHMEKSLTDERNKFEKQKAILQQ